MTVRLQESTTAVPPVRDMAVADTVAAADAVADATGERAERSARLAERRRAARARELLALQQERPEVVGAYAPADFAADALRWTV